ncbi:MAG: glycosyltransferase family 4 protein [Gemmatimonadota bacterium]|nr:glycosyltransferase family 4 protein [Gemmatimonadota bacterium]
MPEPRPTASAGGSVAYVLKAYPRASEPFILSEIFRVEQAGLPLRLYAIKPAEAHDREPRHPVVDRIGARCEYLRRSEGLSRTSLPHWLLHHLPGFFPAIARTLVRHPFGALRVLGAVLAQSWRIRRSAWAGDARVYVKELLLAVDLADRLRHAPEVRHLHAHYAHAATTVAWLTSLITGLPFSFTGHARDIYCESLNPAGLLARKLTAARFTVTCTEANREWLLRLAPAAKVHRIYHGVNADFTSLLATAAGRAPSTGPLRILGVGRLVPKKGFDVLVEAVATLVRHGVTAELVLAGADGSHGAELRERISAHGLEGQVHLIGVVDQRRLYEEYRRATVFCLPCRVLDDGDRDGIPNVLVEAMASGLAVVSTPVSGIPELVVHEENGLLVAPDDVSALAAALLRLHRDPQFATALGQTGRAAVLERFDGDRLAATLAGLLRGAAA